ncbi:MAG: FecR domain-containing protein [Deltaproteobacteria bacterium]|nr:FecR domain-containing protein [Deltaproteobacteria bacterium]
MNPRESLRERQDEVRVGRMWRAIEARRRPAKRRHRVALFGAATIAVAAVVLAVAFWPQPAPEGPLTLAETHAPVPAAIEAQRTLSFADGSRVAAAEESRLDLLENTASELAFALRRGAAHFEVEPGGPRRWRVAAGEVEVIVVGTVFDVERSEGSVTVSVSRGAVRVRGPGVRDGEQRIEAGQAIVVEPPVVEPPVVEEAVESEEPEPEPVVAAERPTPPSAPEPPSARELLADADAARASGDIRAAVHLLERVWREHPRDSRAPLAAFTQGRLELDRLHDSAGAAATLGSALELGLQAPLRETAQALRIDAWGRLGDRRVGAAAERFVAEHPGSEYLDDVRRWLPEPAQGEP